MPLFDSKCTACDWTSERWEKSGVCPPCPLCGAPTEHCWKPNTNRYVQDQIPGGLVLDNLGGQPITVDSWSERKRVMKERGYHEYEGVIPPGERTCIPAILSPEQEAERIRHWREHEAELQGTK